MTGDRLHGRQDTPVMDPPAGYLLGHHGRPPGCQVIVTRLDRRRQQHDKQVTHPGRDAHDLESAIDDLHDDEGDAGRTAATRDTRRRSSERKVDRLDCWGIVVMLCFNQIYAQRDWIAKAPKAMPLRAI